MVTFTFARTLRCLGTPRWNPSLIVFHLVFHLDVQTNWRENILILWLSNCFENIFFIELELYEHVSHDHSSLLKSDFIYKIEVPSGMAWSLWLNWKRQKARSFTNEMKYIYLLFFSFTFENGKNRFTSCVLRALCVLSHLFSNDPMFWVIVPMSHIWKLMYREVKRQTTELQVLVRNQVVSLQSL